MSDSKSNPQTSTSSEETPTEPRVSPGGRNLQNSTIGDFRILRRLGKGGMAEVYLAEQISLKRQVAIKILRADMLDEKDQVLVKRFEQEASAAGGLTHPNIVQVYMVGETKGIHYIAQEYVQGLNLKDFIVKKGPPDLPTAMHIMRQTVAALQAAGDAGIVHRDIKPENIMLTRKGEVKVADFGLAQLSTNAEGVNLTQVGMTMGTPLYMSPEQINGKKVDQRSDIYSFGVTCYHMLSGRPPFEAESPLTIAVKHLNEEPISLAELRPDLPVQLIEVIHKSMAKKPDLRFANAEELLKELKRLTKLLKDDPDTGEYAIGDLSATKINAPTTSLIPPNFSRHVLIFFACCIPVMATSAAIGWWMRTSDPLLIPAQEDKLQIARQETAELQVLQASKNDSLEEWRAVVEYFPDDKENTAKAKYRIASLALAAGRLREAEEILNELSRMGAFDQTAQAVSDAGKAILAYERKEYNKAKSMIAAISNRNSLPQEMVELLRLVEQKLGT